MLDQADASGTSRHVAWRQAAALHLPFPDACLDVVVCQFGVMFFPDKARAFAETRRVLRSGGQFIFNVWDRIEHNDFADTVTRAAGSLFPDDPPRFLARVPHGYHDPAVVVQDIAQGGFTRSPQVTPLPARSRAVSPRIPAIAYCQGTPLRGEIETRDPSRLVEATDVAASAIAHQFGSETVDGKIQAHVVTVEL
jgi:SAM-dependent methyltransferase